MSDNWRDDERYVTDPCGCVFDQVYGNCVTPCLEHDDEYWWTEERDKREEMEEGGEE